MKHLIVTKFRLSQPDPDKIGDDEPLIGGSLGLDSLDACELAICLEDEFGIKIGSRDESRVALASIASLAGFIRDYAPPNAPALFTRLPQKIPA